MTYRLLGLDPSPYASLAGLDDAALLAAGARRAIADENPGYPCRDGLDEAAIGERLLLVNYVHMDVARSPYRAAGPVFVREGARTRTVLEDAWPDYLARRPLSLRAYDAEGLIVEADVVDGRAGEALAKAYLARPDVAWIDAHFARRGCWAARIERS